MKKEYVITFHTHYEAILCKRNLEGVAKEGVNLVKMIPVPRELSSSCGTAIKIETESSFDVNVFSGIEHDEVFILGTDGNYSAVK